MNSKTKLFAFTSLPLIGIDSTSEEMLGGSNAAKVPMVGKGPKF